MAQAGFFRLHAFFVLCFFIFTACCFTACSTSTPPHSTPPPGSGQPSNLKAADSAIALLKTGDVALRAGTGPFSYMLAGLSLKDKSYSHCGIVSVEGGYPYIYHCIGGEDNPDERLRRDSAAFFFSPTRNMGVAIVRYDMQPATIAQLVNVAQAFYRQRPLFDLKFDLHTDGELYCSEFVYKAITRAVNDTGYLHQSYGYGRAFIGIDDLYLTPHAHFVAKVAYK